MRILSWNVNGLRALHKKDLFWNSLAQYNLDVICLQETKSTLEQLPSEVSQIENYDSYFNWPELKKGYSGVAIYTNLPPLSVRTGIENPEMDKEGRVLVADYGTFILLNVYFPNGKANPERLDYKMRFYESFLGYINDLKSSGRLVIFCGDVNTAHKPIDLKNPKVNEKNSGFLPEEREWVENFIDHGYVDSFRAFNKQPEQYTWWSYRFNVRAKNIGWRIDYFFVTKNLMKNSNKPINNRKNIKIIKFS